MTRENPDLTHPRYLDEVGWFLYHEKYGREKFNGSYNEERLAYSRMFMAEVLDFCGERADWLRDKTVVSLGCGCTGDLAVWPAAVKIAIDPLLSVYHKLELLLDDLPGTGATLHLTVGVEDIPLLDDCADLVLCRNALDHMPDPGAALKQISRILRPKGAFFVSVDIGGEPTPDEPTVFSEESLLTLVSEWFDLATPLDKAAAHSSNRPGRVRFMARNRKAVPAPSFDKEAILRAYLARCDKGA